LPVVSSDAETPEPRPAWHWIGFGCVLIFAAWLPLAALLQKLSPLWLSPLVSGATDEREVAARVRALHGGALVWYFVLAALPNAIVLALAAFGGGFVVGRYGKPHAGVREAAFAGALTGLIACALAAAAAGISWALVVVVALAAGFSALGGRFGKR